MSTLTTQFQKRLSGGVKILVACLAAVMCACAGGPRLLEIEGPIDLKIHGEVGYQDLAKIRSHSYERVFERGQLTQEKEEVVDFAVETKTERVDENGHLYQQITVVEKNGNADLHSMAYPELGETLDVVLSPTSRVLRSGSHPRDSIFYLPPIPLPEQPVAVGETWKNEWKWVSSSRVPLRLEMVGILKGIYRCRRGDQSQCALIEVSGDVGLDTSDTTNLSLKSQVSGYIYFSLASGGVIWSEIHNQESLVSMSGGRVDIDSCLESILVLPENDKWMYAEKPTCRAGQEISLPF